MVLCEAHETIKLLKKVAGYKKQVSPKSHNIDNYNALEIAQKCIEAQMRLADVINDMQQDNPKDLYSGALVKDILSECLYTWEGEKNGEL